MTTTQAELFNQVNALRKQGRGEEALRLVRDALRRGSLDPEGIDKAGRLIQKEINGNGIGIAALDILILGQCTTSWLTTALAAAAWGRSLPLRVSDGGYDSILQDLTGTTRSETPPRVVILVPWHKRLLEGGGAAEARIQDEVSFWQQAWQLVKERFHAPVIQVGYDWIIAGPLGQHLSARSDGPVDLVRRMNAALQARLPQDACFVDLEQVSGEFGRASFYDMRRYYWTKQPFSEAGTCRLAEAICGGIQALISGPKKILVLDLDNTLWGGVVGETGPLGVALGDSPEGEAFQAFQKYLKQLAARGVLLAVASKNNPQDAREPFEKNPDMLLRLDDFAAFEACWEPKGVTIPRIATALGLGLDSFVFFDDDPAEREHVRQALPDVEVVEVPVDPAEYVRALESGHWFETTSLTREDEGRSEQYTIERRRREQQASFSSMDDYLRSLEMVGDVRTIADEDLVRVAQLVAKTNQFNLTTRRHTQEDIARLIALPGVIALTLRLRDRFGDHGLVSVLLAVPDGGRETIRIDTWLMSCRVISRTAEQFLFGDFLERCRTLGYRRIVGEYIPTKKNGLVANLFEKIGFLPLPDKADGVARFDIRVDAAVAPVTFVNPHDPG